MPLQATLGVPNIVPGQTRRVRTILAEALHEAGDPMPVKRDLGLISDLAAFREQMEIQWEKMAAQLDAMIRALQDG